MSPLLDRSSLGGTLDALADALFFHRPIPVARRTAAARWIAGRQGLPGAYAGTFAPTGADDLGFHVFTGEVVRSRAGIGHLLGEEACRVLAALEVNEPKVQTALDGAVEGMAEQIDAVERQTNTVGTYCCATCSTVFWRNLANHLLPRADERLHLGLRALRQARDGDGTWRRFPFYLTSLALTEIGPDRAKAELAYAARRWRPLLPRLERATSPLACRRAAVGRKLLELSE